jgi:hypothetical protein
MKTLIIDASGHICFSWKSEHAISHFLQPLHLASSLAIQIGSLFFFAKLVSLKTCEFSLNVCSDLSVMFTMVIPLSKVV